MPPRQFEAGVSCTTDKECNQRFAWDFCTGDVENPPSQNAKGAYYPPGQRWPSDSGYRCVDNLCTRPDNIVAGDNANARCIHPRALNGETRFCGQHNAGCCPGSVCKRNPVLEYSVCQIIEDSLFDYVMDLYCDADIQLGIGRQNAGESDPCGGRSNAFKDCYGDRFCGYDNAMFLCPNQGTRQFVCSNKPQFFNNGNYAEGEACIHHQNTGTNCKEHEGYPCCPGSSCEAKGSSYRCVKMEEPEYTIARYKSCAPALATTSIDNATTTLHDDVTPSTVMTNTEETTSSMGSSTGALDPVETMPLRTVTSPDLTLVPSTVAVETGKTASLELVETTTLNIVSSAVSPTVEIGETASLEPVEATSVNIDSSAVLPTVEIGETASLEPVDSTSANIDSSSVLPTVEIVETASLEPVEATSLNIETTLSTESVTDGVDPVLTTPSPSSSFAILTSAPTGRGGPTVTTSNSLPVSSSTLLAVGISLGVIASIISVVLLVLFYLHRKRISNGYGEHVGSIGSSQQQRYRTKGHDIAMETKHAIIGEEGTESRVVYDELVDPVALLEELGMGDYVEVFEAADLLSADHILDLNDDELASLGIPLGARRRYHHSVAQHMDALALKEHLYD